MKINRLKCPNCGGDLILWLHNDGQSEYASRYNANYAPNWDWEVCLLCNTIECMRVYPICRTSDNYKISDIKWD